MKKLILGSILLVSAQFSQALDAPAAIVPAGLIPGDQFYVMFATSTTVGGNLTVAQYNTHVNTAANLSSAKGTDDASITWSAWLAHDDGTVQTLSLFAEDTTKPVYNTNGDILANDRTDLLDSSLAATIEYDEAGVSAGINEIYTGTDPSGSPFLIGNDTLGGTDSGTDGCLAGNRAASNALAFASSNTHGGNGCTGAAKIYAVSPLLTVPAPTPTDASALQW